MKQLLIAKWVLPIAEPALKNAGVVVEADKIVDVGPAQELEAAHPDAKKTDFGRAVILPGFVDLHTHLEYSAFRGACDDLPYVEWKIQLIKKGGSLQREDWLASARAGAVESARSGITTIADITQTGVSLDAALEMGLRGVVFCEFLGMDPAQVDSIIDEAKKKTAAWQEKASGSRLTVGIAPSAPHSVCSPLLLAASDWARDESLKVGTHLAGTRDEHEFIKYGSSSFASSYRDAMGWSDLLWQPTGTSPVKYLLQWGFFDNDILAVHCVHVDRDDIEILRSHDVAIAHCPKCSAKLGMGTAPLREFTEFGMRVGLGTDSPASNNTMDIFDEMRIGLLLRRASSHTINQFEAEVFVRLATLGGAEALGISETVGSLEVGKQADIIAVDLSHSHQRPLTDPYSALVYTANQENLVLTMVDGDAIFADGRLNIENEEEILQRVEPVREKTRL